MNVESAGNRLDARSRMPFVALSGELPDSAIIGRASGVGLIRSEYLVRASGFYWTRQECRRHVSTYVSRVLEAAAGKQVWYRLSDMEARDVNVLAGCDVVHNDDNPILGPRGLRRTQLALAALDHELDTFAALSRDSPELGLLLPYCRDAEEVAFGMDRARAAGHTGPIGVMLEVPSAVLQAGTIMRLGVGYCLIGMNDLTGLTLGAARTAPDFDQTHPAVLHLVRRLLAEGAEANVPVRIAGNYDGRLPAALPDLPASSFVVHYSNWHELVDPELTDYRDKGLVQRLRRQSDARLVAAGLMNEADVVISAGLKL